MGGGGKRTDFVAQAMDTPGLRCLIDGRNNGGVKRLALGEGAVKGHFAKF